jgi:hypothetical protein
MHDVKAARQLASDITQSGAKLYDLLENENTERQERAKALRFLDLAASASGMYSPLINTHIALSPCITATELVRKTLSQ